MTSAAMDSIVAPLLSVAPTRALVDEMFTVRVENLPPCQHFTLHSLHLSEDNDYWEAFGHYTSNHKGTVVPQDYTKGGTYTGKEPMGLLWSLRPVPGSRKGLRLRKMNVCSPLLYTISVYSGHLVVGFRAQAPLASALAERWYMAPGVQRISIKEKAVRGTMFFPPGTEWPLPWTLGYYFGPGEMETTEMKSNYFETAFNIVKDHPRVISNKVGIVGLSLGATVAFYLATESKVVKPCCCVCINGHHFNPSGKHLFDLSYDSFKMHVRKLSAYWIDCFEYQESIIIIYLNFWQMGKINCPMLLVCGEDDQNVPAVEVADDIERMVRAAGKDRLLTRLNYPGAGHLIEVPYAPHFRVTAFMQAKEQKVMIVWGGQTKPHSDAQEDSWQKILDYLQLHLYSCPSLASKL
uniref:Acyl-CoA thioesterase 15 n=1 Tax=Neogobius melanostomus TaxID=47308 RepID=A0A8C6WSA7_9GOBI